ncbi:MAG: hypothetical protein CMA63_07490 [Euryarchaeota archaeon]|nr:hypothetical protein [Euryarchaeota archaeon]|tara:strand:- start:3525 stop:5552 length:2028 start_codon:yes stop_codon:yes gene_type:complete
MVFLLSMFSPFADLYVGDASAEDTLVCCDSVPVDLYLLGSASAGSMSPFTQDLGDSTMSATIASAVTSEETVGKWTLPNVWPGTIPANTWKVSMSYEVSDAAGAQVNATATLKIGAQTFSASTDPGSSFLAQGTGTLVFDIDIDAASISDNGLIELTLTARSIVFTLPTGEAKIEFQWGSEDSDSNIEAEIPLMDLTLLEPEVEGSDVYFSVVIDSNWGMDILSKSDVLEMRIAGTALTGDPIETTQGEGVRVTWTWQGAKGGVESVEAEIRVVLQTGSAALTGSTSFEIETFDSSGGTGTYYPPDEPLKTNGDGSPLQITGTFSLASSGGELKIERETSIKVSGEMAFWMRWGMDHIGDEVTSLSPVLKSFDAGSVSDDDRVSRTLESIEVTEFERQMLSATGSGLCAYYLSVGLGLDVEELLGYQTKEFETLSINVDLNGESDVVNHPITLVISTTKVVADGERIPLMGSFIIAQPSPLWSDYSLMLTGSTSGLTSFSGAALSGDGTSSIILSHSRLPWGESLTIEGQGIDQDDQFRLMVSPTSSPVHSPIPLSLIVLFGLVIGFFTSLRLTKTRQRGILYVELVLVPLVAGIHFLAYPPLFVGASVGTTILIWWVTSVTSPRSRTEVLQEAMSVTTPVIPCPACSTPNPVPSDERPLRFACLGCSRVIKIVA